MKRKTILGTTILAAMACCAQAQVEDGAKCTNETLKGAYGVQLSGTRAAPSVPTGMPGFVGQIEQVIGIVILVFDGKGNFTQTDNVKGGVSGFIPDRPGGGTYVVNSDCSATNTVHPAPGVTIVTRIVIVNGGKEYRGFTVTPDSTNITTVGLRIN